MGFAPNACRWTTRLQLCLAGAVLLACLAAHEHSGMQVSRARAVSGGVHVDHLPRRINGMHGAYTTTQHDMLVDVLCWR